MCIPVVGLGSMGFHAALDPPQVPGIEVAGADPRDAARAEFTGAGGQPAPRPAGSADNPEVETSRVPTAADSARHGRA